MPQAEKPDSTTTSRRRFLAATATAAAAASVAATASAGAAVAESAPVTAGENPALVALGAEFDRLLQIEREAWEATPDDNPESSWKLGELAQNDVSKVVEQILLLPALTMDGLRLKARTVAWCHGCSGPDSDKPVL